MENLIKIIYDDANSINSDELIFYLNEENEILVRNDPRINMMNGGDSIIKKIGEDQFSYFSSGQNWTDQSAEIYNTEQMKSILDEILISIQNDFEKYAFDTDDLKVCYIKILE